MNYRIILDESFRREVKRLSKKYLSLKEDLRNLQKEILANPNLGVNLGGGVRKIRMKISSKGKGKSGGARIITFNIVLSLEETEINLLFIYDKVERDSIRQSEIEELLNKNGLR